MEPSQIKQIKEGITGHLVSGLYLISITARILLYLSRFHSSVNVDVQ